MERIFKEKKGEGSTTKLIQRSHISKAIIICLNENIVRQVKKMSCTLSLDIPEPMSYYTLNKTEKIRGLNVSLLLDDYAWLTESYQEQTLQTIKENNLTIECMVI